MSVERADAARFFAQTAPFDVLDEATVAEVVPQLKERLFRRGYGRASGTETAF